METMGERLAYARNRKRWSQSDLARAIKVKPQSIQAIEGGGGTKHGLALARALGVSPEWLVDGHGPMLAEPDDTAPTHDDLVAVSGLAVEVSAGGGAVVAVEDESDRWYFSRNLLRYELGVSPNQVRVVTVKGDSMAGVLESQDRILVDISDRTPSPPGIFVLWDGMGLVVKRVEHIPNSDPPRFRLVSANPAYQAYELTADEIYVVGRAVWFARRL